MAMLLLAPAMASACASETSGLDLDAPSDVRDFLSSQPLDGIHGYQPLLVESRSKFLLFEVSYGPGTACSAVCEYGTAVGLSLSGRIGWLVAPVGAAAATLFVIQPTDTVLFQTELLTRVTFASAAAATALKAGVARMTNAPPATLSYIISGLSCCGSDSIGLALLDNATVRQDEAVLEAMIGKLIFGAAHDRAWSYLAPLVGPVSSLSWSGAPFTPQTPYYAGYASAAATAVNRTAKRVVFEVPSVCAPSLLVYRDSAYTVQAWDGGRWHGSQAGGCKAFPSLRAVASGDSARFAAMEDPRIILGDSLPAGRYYLGIRPEIYNPMAGPALVRAGPVDLSK